MLSFHVRASSGPGSRRPPCCAAAAPRTWARRSALETREKKGRGRRSDVLAAVCTRPAAVVLAASSRSFRGTAAVSPPNRGHRAGHAAITAPCPSLARPPTLWRPCAGTSILAAMAAMDPSPPRTRSTRNHLDRHFDSKSYRILLNVTILLLRYFGLETSYVTDCAKPSQFFTTASTYDIMRSW